MSRLGALASVLTLSVAGTVAAGLPASAVLDKKAPPSAQAQINKVVNALKAGEHSTYEATYTADYTGVSQTVTMAQKPPKTLFKMIGGSLTVGTAQFAGSELDVNTGKKIYSCNIDKSPATCFAETSGGSISEESVFLPAAVIFALESFEATKGSNSTGVTSSTQRFGGQSATCVSIQSAHPVKYCATSKGVLASVSAAGNTLALKRVSSSASSSLFKLPAGAQVEGVNGAIPPA